MRVLHGAIAEIAVRQAALLAEYQLLEASPGINSTSRRAPLLDAYAELEVCASTLRREAGPVAAPSPVITVGPPARIRGQQRRAGLYTPPPAPVRTTVVAKRSASWWTKPNADFRAEAERIRQSSVVTEIDILRESRTA
jgi:hypothetical protein